LNVKAARRPEAREVSSPAETSTKLTATNEELREELEEVRQEKRELERQIAERTGKIPGSVDVGKVEVTTGRRFNGRVLVVNQKHNFVVIDVGKIHGLEKGVVLIVHRGNRFIGKAQVVKVYEKMAAADLVADWMQEDVQVSDGVKKF
jgi:cell shape-determining protein MreC